MLAVATAAAIVVPGSGCAKKSAAAGGMPAMPPIQVVAVDVVQRPVVETLSLVGTMAANEFVEIRSETDGAIQQINFDEGQPVKKDQLLVLLDESKLAAAVAEGEANFKLSQANYERSRQLFRDNLISPQEFDQTASSFEVNRASLDLRKRNLKDARVLAPFSGVMGARTISPGQVVTRNTALAWLVQNDPIKVEVSVPERFLGQLRMGAELELRVAALQDRVYRGKVYFIAPFVEDATRTVLVKARIPNADLILRPGMFANLDLALQMRESALVIPEVALMPTGERTAIFVVGPNMVAELRPITMGIRLPGQVEVTSGLKPGEKVVVVGVQKLRPGATVMLAPAASMEPYLFKTPKPADAAAQP
jgi:membrane fusion protein (multidrug efflux system)